MHGACLLSLSERKLSNGGGTALASPSRAFGKDQRRET